MTTVPTFSLNPVRSRRLLILAALGFTLWACWKVSKDDVPSIAVSKNTNLTQRRVGSKELAAAPSFALNWFNRSDPKSTVVDLFTLVPPPPLAPASVSQQALPPAPVLALKYIGQLDGSDTQHVFLTDGKEQVIAVKVGQSVADGWQLTAMNSKQLVFRHTATGHEQTMLIGSFP